MTETHSQSLTTFTPPRRLTKQQFRAVALLYRDGLTYRQVAKAMGISVRTVRHHIADAASWLPGDANPAWKVLRHGDKLLELGFTDTDIDVNV